MNILNIKSCALLVTALLVLSLGIVAVGQDEIIPRGQSKPPNRPYSPAEAIAKMEVPEGFSVEVVASEPDLVNPTAMAFDERGRIWVTESLEYPRMDAGQGRDRIKILEDTDQDGRVDKVTIFADDLNIPCGIAVGYGGVWVSNSPDILFLQDTDGDGRADRREVVVTGFGRYDTHELPNSLVWGPDGYLYGLNGVFNNSHIEQDGRRFDFTCAMFRIDPRTHKFELFAEGTSNPWGIAWNDRGDAFLSACVIDHLWHLTETGYYHRQAGAYPPHTWKIESIVDHKHQQAAYCGIHYFDSDAYPVEYRNRLYMGNIHGNCINVDSLTEDGATYRGEGHPDFLTANDAWFMPVSQKTGPDGCLYILDWYDRYHCYQDARRDPEGIDRLNGRIYRVRYRETPRATDFDMMQESDDQLMERLSAQNDYIRWTAQRVLSERADDATKLSLKMLVVDRSLPLTTRLHAMWAWMGTRERDDRFLFALMLQEEPLLRAWAVRAAGNQRDVSDDIRAYIRSNLCDDESAPVRLQVAITLRKLSKVSDRDALLGLLQVLGASADDPLIPHIVWQNLHALLETESEAYADAVRTIFGLFPGVQALVPRCVDRILANDQVDFVAVSNLMDYMTESEDVALREAAVKCLDVLASRVQSREISGDTLHDLQAALAKNLDALDQQDETSALFASAQVLKASWGEESPVAFVRELFADRAQSESMRLRALSALVSSGSDGWLSEMKTVLESREEESVEFRGRVVTSLGRLESPQIASILLGLYDAMEPDLQPKVIELLTGRSEWSKTLIEQIAADTIAPAKVNVNQVRKMLSFDDEELSSMVAKHWGTLRTERSPGREQVIAQMQKLITSSPGNPVQGAAVFEKVCGQCHKIYGKGFDVGPDITANGRGNLEQLLSNVFDPSLVIGADYQARTVITIDGRVETGLLAEANDQRVVLRPQGGKEIVIARDEIESMGVSKLSLMPEDLEKQLEPQEIVDLFAFLTLDRPPSDPDAKSIQGAEQIKRTR